MHACGLVGIELSILVRLYLQCKQHPYTVVHVAGHHEYKATLEHAVVQCLICIYTVYCLISKFTPATCHNCKLCSKALILRMHPVYGFARSLPMQLTTITNYWLTTLSEPCREESLSATNRRSSSCNRNARGRKTKVRITAVPFSLFYSATCSISTSKASKLQMYQSLKMIYNNAGCG